ncbi:pyocin knob domain-containing protein [Bacteroides stercoris]|uniref:pyocin knob domain-containing protein n=1 Tax=Bacteroides stercoris TaxID=46506 RepID=UPI0034A2CD97
MAWTEQDYQEIVARLMANSIGVNEVPNADKADDVTSLPAFKPSGSNSEASVVNYPLEFLKGEQGEPGIQGEPGKSFKVAGEYATLEALKSAVPDGSAVDGFMAVGTEAPYDYYAWVNGEWVSQGKIGGIEEAPTDGKAYGRKNGDWAEVPEHLNLTSENLNDINGAGFATQKSAADYTSPENNYPINENGALIFANANYGHSNQIYGSYLTNRWFARGGGNQQGVRTNWKEFAFTDDVLTKTNTSSFTPTGDYQPATKKYADNINYGKVINVSVGTYLVTNKNEKDREAIDLINTIFGSVDNLKEIIQDIIANHTKYYFHSYNSKDNCIELSSIYSFHNPETEEYNLQCNISYYTNNGPVSKRMGFKLMPNDEDCAASIEDILTSDNLQRVVKRTKTEYDSIGTKNEYTMYATTDA